MIEGLGLSTAELMLARGSAVKYAGKRDKPARLVELMMRFGLNFLTLEALTLALAKMVKNYTTRLFCLSSLHNLEALEVF